MSTNHPNLDPASDITEDPFAEYLRAREPSRRELAGAWQVAIGLQAVDGLTPSRYLVETAKRSVEGEITLQEAEHLVTSYYRQNPHQALGRTDEADVVATRIAQLLSEQAFVFSPVQYLGIHRRLFAGVYDHAGKIRDFNVTKKEWVLDGDTVTYGGASELEATLDYDFAQERAFDYTGLGVAAAIEHIARFISRLWQIHVFAEGNTRTTAVFLIKYLRSMGYKVDNEPFTEHAWYFRNSLVRANYSNVHTGIRETTEYTVAFLRNILLGEHHELKNRYMHISGYFKPENLDIHSNNLDIHSNNLDIHSKNLDIHSKNLDIQNRYGLPPVSARYAAQIAAAYAAGQVFSRADVIPLLGLAPASASALLKKLLDAGLIEPVQGQGKGKYRLRG